VLIVTFLVLCLLMQRQPTAVNIHFPQQCYFMTVSGSAVSDDTNIMKDVI